MRLYLDNCVFNRPYDDQTQIIIRREAEAKLEIQQCIRDGQHQLIWSYMLDYENARNPYEDRREQIGTWKRYAQFVVTESLSSLDTLIAAQAEKLDALKTHKKGLMQQLFPRPETVSG